MNISENFVGKILLCEFRQESNTFNPIVMGMDYFTSGYADEGQVAYERVKARPIAAHGMIDAIEEAGGEVVPTIFLDAPSGGRVDDDVFEHVKQRVKYYIDKAGEVDAVCISLHGATCTVSEDDACGALLKYIRELVGDKPIAASFDLHANITKRMLKYADIICGYQTYPHVDFYETGYRAGKLCMQMLAGKKFVKAAVTIPMLIPPSGFTNLEGPFKELIDTGNALVADGTLIDYTVFPVQPWLDIPELASVVVTIAEDSEVAKEQADRLAQQLFEKRDEYTPELMSVDEIIDIAEDPKSVKPIVLADSADSVNGGAVGDSPVVAMRLAERESQIQAGMFVVDPEAVQKAFETGIGNCAEFSVGAGYTYGMPGPFREVGMVRSLHDGNFRAEGPANKGVPGSMGLCAVISFGNIDILVSEKCDHSGDPQLFRHFGIEPTMYDLIVVKANTSFKVPYGKFAGQICYADTPGAGASNLKRFQWQNISENMYPFDLPEDYKLEKAKVYWHQRKGELKL